MDNYNNKPKTDSTEIKAEEQFATNFEALFYLLGGSF